MLEEWRFDLVKIVAGRYCCKKEIKWAIFTFSELLGDILAEKPVEVFGTECIIVVDNVPVIPPDRLEKLKNVIRKVFSKFGKLVMEHYPQDDNGHTKGWGSTLHLKNKSSPQLLQGSKLTFWFRFWMSKIELSLARWKSDSV